VSRFPKKKLTDAFHERLGADVSATSEVIAGVKRFSFYLVSRKFKGVSHLRRQDMAWEVVDSVLTREQALQVSAILALAPGEIEEFAGV
jgi:hypothetical protein